jgi:murein DD-endopeptidase MepM/ murein hydrolase activator NlpD
MAAAVPAGAAAPAAAAMPWPATASVGMLVGSGASAGDWTWPVSPPVRVIAPFLAPPTPYSAGHRGIDIAASAGDGIVAPAPGVVTFAGRVAGRGVVAIDHGDGIVSAIEPVSASVDAGAAVDAGAPVGLVATGGHCDGSCVHFGVRLHGEYVSPLLFLGGVPRAVLLPLR